MAWPSIGVVVKPLGGRCKLLNQLRQSLWAAVIAVALICAIDDSSCADVGAHLPP
jgi:hypothetical protein